MFVTHPRGGDRASCVTVCLFSPPAVMKFMGDHPPRGQTELDIVCTLLKVIPRAMGVVAAGTSPAVERAVRVP